MPKKPVIALVTGGYSGEAVISYKSARTIENNLDRSRYTIYRIDIRPEGWFCDTDAGRISVDLNDFSVTVGGQRISFDAVLIGMHGTPGEDGKLQGYFDMLGIPYTSCDAAASAITFNKRYTLAVAAFAGINTARSLHLFREHVPGFAEEARTVLQQLTLPLFVKPNNGGSSIGISKVNQAEELPDALEKAFREDDQVLVEEFIAGREFTVGVFRTRSEVIVLPITEVISHKDFFDYEAKYEGKSEEVTPANIDEETTAAISAAARKVYEIFNCRGVVRIDFIFNEAVKKPFLLEINTVPGQSEASIVPQQVKKMGWTLQEFYSALVEEALSRSRSAKSIA